MKGFRGIMVIFITFYRQWNDLEVYLINFVLFDWYLYYDMTYFVLIVLKSSVSCIIDRQLECCDLLKGL
jgi:hypothetical protein